MFRVEKTFNNPLSKSDYKKNKNKKEDLRNDQQSLTSTELLYAATVDIIGYLSVETKKRERKHADVFKYFL